VSGDPMVGFAIFAGVLGIFGGMWWFSPDQVTKRLLRASPVTPLVKTSAGMIVRVTGRVRPVEETLEGPLSGRPCTWYGVYVDEWRQRGKSGHWAEIIKEERGVDFYLDDGTAVALVRCRSLRVVSVKDVNSSSGLFDDATPVEMAMLTKYFQADTNTLGMNRRLRYREAAFEPGEHVTALGVVNPTRDVRARYEITPTSHGELVMSDDPGVVR